MKLEVFVHTTKPSNKVVFEGTNCPLSSILSVHSERDKLIVNLLLVHEILHELGAFIVETLQAWA